MPSTLTPPKTSADIRQQFINFFVEKHAHTFVPSSPVVPHDDPTLLFTNAGMNQFKPYFLGTAKSPAEWGGRAANTQKCIRAGGKHNDLDDVGRSRRHHTFFEMLGNWSFGNYFKQGAIEMTWELLTKTWGLDPTRLHVSCYEGNDAVGIPRDTEAADIWKKVANWEQYGLNSDDFIHYFGKDNFWEMGDTGPCGPCTEIYIDRTPDKSGGPEVNGNDPRVMEIWNLVFIQYNRDASGKLTPLPSQHVDTGMGLERICQVLQNKDDNYGTDLFTPIFDTLTKLTGITYHGKFPKTNAADPIAEAADPQLRHDIAFRVIADHVRCLTFALTDGAVPSNEGRGYVLRRILRRAVRFGRQQLGLAPALGPGNNGAFLYKLVPVVVDTMGHMFPELKKNPAHVVEIIKEEEISFGKTLDRGIALFEDAATDALRDRERRAANANPSNTPPLVGSNAPAVDVSGYGERESIETVRARIRSAPATISAESAFKLYDTYGFPIDLTRIMAEERGMTVDLAGYDKLMEEAKTRSRGVDKTAGSTVYDLPPNILDELQKLHIHPTDDSFKYKRGPIRATLRAIWDGTTLDESTDASDTRAGQHVALILDKTNFYSEMGGQVGDTGELRTDSNNSGTATFLVETTRAVGPFVLHIGHVKSGKLEVADALTATVLAGGGGRDATEKNHTATHLANWALRETLGDHVQQKGSLVDPEKLRFDFVHPKSLTDEELAKVESLVNAAIEKKLPVFAETAPQETALKIHGLRAVFGEKYPPLVRVVSIGNPVADLLQHPDNAQWKNFSVEFCGGNHLPNTADAERFVIIGEESVSKGIRRLVALTGPAARDALTQGQVIESLITHSASTEDANLPALIAALQKSVGIGGGGGGGGGGINIPLLAKRHAQAKITELQDRHKKWTRSQAHSDFKIQNSDFNLDSLLTRAETINNILVLVASVPDASADTLRTAWDWLKKKHPDQQVAALLASEFQDTDKDGNKLPPKVNLLAGVGDPLIDKLKAGDWIKAIAPLVGGSGGGRPQLAMAGGKDPTHIQSALTAARDFAHSKLA
jgi:alanyl-tRNA synthetase